MIALQLIPANLDIAAASGATVEIARHTAENAARVDNVGTVNPRPRRLPRLPCLIHLPLGLQPVKHVRIIALQLIPANLDIAAASGATVEIARHTVEDATRVGHVWPSREDKVILACGSVLYRRIM